MSITRSQAERVLLRRVGKLFEKAGLDYTSDDGSNLDLNDPIAVGLLRLGLTVADIADVKDSDLSALSTDDHLAFLDLAEYRALGNIVSNIEMVDVQVGPVRERTSQLSGQIDKRMERLAEDIENMHGIGGGSLEIGVVDLNFQTRDDDTIV